MAHQIALKAVEVYYPMLYDPSILDKPNKWIFTMTRIVILIVGLVSSCATTPKKVCLDGKLFLHWVASGKCEGSEDMPYKNGKPDWSFFEGDENE